MPRIFRTRGTTSYEVTSDTEANHLLAELVDEIRGMRYDMAQMDGAAIIDGRGSMRRATVSPTGALSVAPTKYDETATNTMSATATAFNFFSPSPGEQFVITGVVTFATKDVSDASDTIVTVYEADESTSITVDKTLLEFGMGKLTNLPLVPLNILVNPGVYVNAKTDDATINMTIMGYFIDIS